ncbi:MAG: T9SS type A sorting domain-containing protein [Bacteroidia bacterium]|nr:T9SS type A sorting domain-containing protein [Bacteroidia bacterium]
MKKILIISVMVCMCIQLNAQYLDWVKQIGGASIDRALAVTTDASGNIYATGQYDDWVDFDPGPDTLLRGATSSGEAFLIKLDATGNLQKLLTYGYTGSGHTVVGSNIALDASGNIFTGGYFGGSNVDFDPDSIATFKLSYVGGGNNVFIQKLDPSGKFLWAVSWCYAMETNANNMSEIGPSMVLDGLGNVLTTGRFNGTRDFDPSPTGVFNLPGGAYDGYISKLNTDGEFVWAKQFAIGTSILSYIWPKSISVDGANNMYVAGLFKGEVDFDPDTAATHKITSETQVGFLAKLSADGDFLWVKTIGNNDYPLFDYHKANAVTADAAGNTYLTGSFMRTTNFGSMSLTSAGSSDIFITKLDPSGNFVWAKQIGSFYDTEEGDQISLDENGDVYITGIFRGSPDFNPGPGSTILSTNGTLDMFVLKLTASGDFVWAKNYGGAAGTAGEQIADIAIDGNAIYTVGRFQGVVNFDPNGVLNLTPVKSDIFIHKMSQGALSISKLVNDLGAVIYPNPTTDQFVVQLPGVASMNAAITLMDIQGRIIQKVSTTGTETVIDVTTLPKGLYMLDIQKDSKRTIQKLIVR